MQVPNTSISCLAGVARADLRTTCACGVSLARRLPATTVQPSPRQPYKYVLELETSGSACSGASGNGVGKKTKYSGEGRGGERDDEFPDVLELERDPLAWVSELEGRDEVEAVASRLA